LLFLDFGRTTERAGLNDLRHGPGAWMPAVPFEV